MTDDMLQTITALCKPEKRTQWEEFLWKLLEDGVAEQGLNPRGGLTVGTAPENA